MTKPEPKRARGRPSAASTSRPVTLDKRKKGGKRVADIDKELLTLSCDGAPATIAAKMEIANLQAQRWTLLSCDATLNFREQKEASDAAQRWTYEFRQLSQRQADDLVRELHAKMHEQEDAANRLERL